jgi:predicted nucleic acid-binding protein
MDDAANAPRKVVLSVISLAEIVYLIEKNRLPASAYDDLKSALADPEHVLEIMPLNEDIVEAMPRVPRVSIRRHASKSRTPCGLDLHRLK